MLVPEIEAQKYGDKLDHFLTQLKGDLLAQSKNSGMVLPAIEDLDEYLLELNTYYYASFHQKFFPLYRKIIEADTRSLYNIGLQEKTLKKDVLTNLKQHAHLFNKVESVLTILKVRRAETSKLLLTYPENEERNVELLYIFKELANEWTEFQELLDKMQKIADDEKLLPILHQYPAHAAIANLINQREDNLKADRDLIRLMASWQLAIKVLVKLQENQSLSRENIRTSKAELEKTDAAWDNRKIPADVRSWYKQYIQKTFNFYIELIYLHGEKNDLKHSRLVAGQFEEWLKALLYLLEISLFYKTHGDSELIANAFLLNRIEGDYLKELSRHCSRNLKSLEDLINSLTSSSQADYQYYSQSSSQLLSEAYQLLNLQINNNNISGNLLLLTRIDRLKNKIALVESRVDLLDQKASHSVAITNQYQLSLDVLDSLLEMLSAIQEELIGSLSPRNIKRNYPDINLQINHLSLKVGESFPPQLLYLVKDGSVESRAADAPSNQILYAEGDIFKIILDDLQEVIIPKVIVAKKG